MGSDTEAYLRWLEDIGTFPRRTIGGSFYKSLPVKAPPKSEFDKLLDELDAAYAERDARRRADPSTESVSARLSVNGQMVKSIRWAEPTAKRPPAPAKPKRHVVIIKREPGPADRVRTAFAMLSGNEITPQQRVALTAALANLNSAPSQPFMKAMPAHENPSDAALPPSARGIAARLKEVDALLAQHVSASHLAEAERLLAGAQKMLTNPEHMSMGDAAALTVQLADLRQKIAERSHA